MGWSSSSSHRAAWEPIVTLYGMGLLPLTLSPCGSSFLFLVWGFNHLYLLWYLVFFFKLACQCWSWGSWRRDNLMLEGRNMIKYLYMYKINIYLHKSICRSSSSSINLFQQVLSLNDPNVFLGKQGDLSITRLIPRDSSMPTNLLDQYQKG